MARPQFEPMSVGQILDRTFVLYKNNFARFIAIVAIVQVPASLLMILVRDVLPQLAISADADPLSLLLPTMIGLMLLLLLTALAQQLSIGALAKCVSESYLGNEATVGQVYRFVWPKLWRLFGVSLLVGLIQFAGFMLLIVPGVIFSVWFILTSQTIVIEDRGAIEAMGRSKALVKANFWRILGLAVVIILITWIVSAIFTYAGILIAKFIKFENPLLSVLIAQPFGLIGQVLAAPIGATAFVLLYYDLRIRKEGFDLEMLARSIGSQMSIPDVPPIRPEPPA